MRTATSDRAQPLTRSEITSLVFTPNARNPCTGQVLPERAGGGDRTSPVQIACSSAFASLAPIDLSSVCQCDEASNRSSVRAGYVRRCGGLTDCLGIEPIDSPEVYHYIVR